MTYADPNQLFDNWAKAYNPAANSSENDFPFAGYKLVLDEVMRLAEVEPGMRVLDLGIGTGNLAERFLATGCEVWGCDFSAEMLARARAQWPQIHLLKANLLEEWPCELRGPFDRVVSAYVLHHFDLPTKVDLLRRVASQSLAEGGRILIADVAFPTVAVRSAAAQRWADRWDDNEHYMAADETVHACRQIGLQIAYRQVSSCAGIFIVSR